MEQKKPDYKIEYGSQEWWLYHHYDNEKPVIPLIVLSCFLLICKGGQLLIIVIWVIYFSWASDNNKKLDNDPKILKAREDWKWAREHFDRNKYK